MKREDIIQSLIKNRYPNNVIDSVADELMSIDKKLIPLLLKWVEDNTETDYAVEGFTLLELKDVYKMSYPAALLSIDWLIKEPHIAKQAISKGIK